MAGSNRELTPASRPPAPGATPRDGHRGARRRGPHSTARTGGGSLVLLSDAITCFLGLARLERRFADRTVTLYAQALQHLDAYARAHKRERLAELTPNLLRGAAAHAMESGTATNWRGGEAQAVNVIKATRTMVRRLHDEYPDLPLPDLSMVKAPKIPDRIQPRLDDGDFARLEAAVRMRLLRERVPRFLIARDLALLLVLANTGLRAAECCGLNVDDVDLDEGTITVRKGKGGKWRILTVLDPDERDGGEVVRALDDYLRYRQRIYGPGRTPALWLTPKGNRLETSGLRKTLRAMCEEAGIDGNRPPHAFRRSYFSDEYRDNPTALPVLVERMGWDPDSGMAKVYTRGVDVELARRVQLPLASKKWRQRTTSTVSKLLPGRKVNRGSTEPRFTALAGSGGRNVDEPPPPVRGRRDGERPALQSSRRSLPR
jgi:integrase